MSAYTGSQGLRCEFYRDKEWIGVYATRFSAQ